MLGVVQVSTSFFTGFSHKSENEIHEQALNQQKSSRNSSMAKNGLKSEDCLSQSKKNKKYILVADFFRIELNFCD